MHGRYSYTTCCFVFQDWYRRLHFISLTADDFGGVSKKGAISENPFNVVLKSKLSAVRHTASSAVIVLLPDLDAWPMAVQLRDDSEGDDPNDPQHTSWRSQKLFSSLYTALRQADHPICVLATGTDASGLLKHRDLRNLFYRQALVSLPNGQQRARLLANEVRRYSSKEVKEEEMMEPGSSSLLPKSVASAEECQRISSIAASLHGYTATYACFTP